MPSYYQFAPFALARCSFKYWINVSVSSGSILPTGELLYVENSTLPLLDRTNSLGCIWSRRVSHQAPIRSPSSLVIPKATGNPRFAAISAVFSSSSIVPAITETPCSWNAACALHSHPKGGDNRVTSVLDRKVPLSSGILGHQGGLYSYRRQLLVPKTGKDPQNLTFQPFYFHLTGWVTKLI